MKRFYLIGAQRGYMLREYSIFAELCFNIFANETIFAGINSERKLWRDFTWLAPNMGPYNMNTSLFGVVFSSLFENTTIICPFTSREG